jgi:hypothetical protein
MILAPTQVWLVVEAIDMRAGIDGLSVRIQSTLGRSPCDGSAYAFANRRRNRLKCAHLGWYWRVVVSAAASSRSLQLAQCRHRGVYPDAGSMAVAC